MQKIYTFLVLLFITGCSSNNHYIQRLDTNPHDIDPAMTIPDQFAEHFVGYFSNEEAVMAVEPTQRSLFYLVADIVAIQIWKDRAGEYWFYSTRFDPQNPAAPLLQDVFQLVVEDNSEKMLFKVYDLPLEKQKAYAIEWTKEIPFADLSPEDLVPRDGCDATITVTNNGFQSQLQEDYCKLPKELLRVAMYHANIGITPEQVEMGLTFYAKDSSVIFSYEEPLVYKRLPKGKIPKRLKNLK